MRKIGQIPRKRENGKEGPLEDWVSYITRATHKIERESKEAGVADWIVEQRRRKWRWAGHVARMSGNRWTKLLLDWVPVGKRRVGRPTKRWDGEILEFAETEFDGRAWPAVEHNRDEWKTFEDKFARR